MIATRSAPTGLALPRRALGASRPSALPNSSTQQQQRNVVVRFKENDGSDVQKELQNNLKDVQQELGQLPFSRAPTASRLSPEEQQEVRCAAASLHIC
jgi:hypothetical protein